MEIKVEDHLGLAFKIANRIKSEDSYKSFEEIYSDALLGLVLAAKKFDKSRGLAFTTYAYPTILGTIKGQFYRDKSKFRRIKVDGKDKYEQVHCSSLNELTNINDDSSREKIELLQSCPYETLENKVSNRVFLSEILDRLEEKERKVLMLLYYDDNTQAEVGEKLNISQVQVSRIKTKALRKLKEKFCA